MNVVLRFWEIDSLLGPIDVPDDLLDMPIENWKSVRYNNPDLYCFISEHIPLLYNGDLGEREHRSVRVSDGRLLEAHRCSHYLTLFEADHHRMGHGEYPVLVFSNSDFSPATRMGSR